LTDTESTSIGAALLGAIAAGWYPTLESMGILNSPKDFYYPDKESTQIYDEGYIKYRKLYKCHLNMQLQ
jgi:sugar (pentulose or hexulose) kinase